MKTLGFGGTVFYMRVVGGEVSATVFVDFVLRCRVGEDCVVDSWRALKNPFRPPINYLFEGALFGFEGEPITLGEPIALEGGKLSDGGGRTADTV